MQTQNRVLDDLARVAGGALSTLSGLREEIEARVRERVERMAADMDLIAREEFDAVKAMAAKAREEQEKLGEQVARLEARLAEFEEAGAGTPQKRGPTRTRSAAKKQGDSTQDAKTKE